MSRCYAGGHKHKYVARYDEEFCDKHVSFKTAHPPPPEQLRKIMIRKVYLFDICVWCGHKEKK